MRVRRAAIDAEVIVAWGETTSSRPRSAAAIWQSLLANRDLDAVGEAGPRTVGPAGPEPGVARQQRAAGTKRAMR